MTHLAFLRCDAASGQTCLVVLNMSAQPLRLDLTDALRDKMTVECLFDGSNARRAGSADDLAQLAVSLFGVYIGQL